MSISTQLKTYLFGSVFRRGATLLTSLTLISYAMGLVRDVLFARILGASRLLDIYNAAFIIPDVLLNIFVAGALTAAFVPVFTHLTAKDERHNAEQLASTMLRAAPLLMGIIATVAIVLMPWLARLIAPGFSASETSTLIRMSRLLLLSPVLFAASNTLGGMLVSMERFLGYGLSPILYNAGIIGGIFLVPLFGPIGLIIGVIAGAVLHLASRAFAIVRSGFSLGGALKFKDKNFLQVIKLMIPRMAGQPVGQLTFLIFTALASSLAVGSITILNFARNFQSVPVSIFGISFSTAVFASLSRKAALNDRTGIIRQLKETSKVLGLVTIASTLFYIFAGRLVIDIFLGGGAFGTTQVALTAKLLAVFALAIPGESLMHLFVRAFYSLKDTWTPVLIRVPGLALIFLLAKAFMPTLGLNALALSYVITISTEVLILGFLLQKKLTALPEKY